MDLQWTGLYREGDNTIVKHSQDVEPVLEQAKALQNAGMVGSSEMRHAAKIPTSVIENYLIRQGITLHEFMSNQETHAKQLLNDPALAGFRIWKGKI